VDVGVEIHLSSQVVVVSIRPHFQDSEGNNNTGVTHSP
jgi:hypothetical protein